jgi:putative transcriptional regulator
VNVKHHPPAAWLVDHANRTAPDGVSLLVAAHADLCGSCADEIGALVELGGQLLADAEPVAGGDVDALLASLDRAPIDPPRPPPDPILPPVVAAAAGPWASLPWKMLVPGVSVVPLAVAGAATARLTRFRPGFRPPLHTHSGLERTLVLQGGFTDDGGDFRRGDLSVRGAGAHHQVFHTDGPCVCLFVNDGPLVPLTWFGKLLSVFVDA